jgi:hypothetical protein
VGTLLGTGLQKGVIISSAILAVLPLFYVYSAASFFQLRVYPLVNRVTYYSNFQAFIVSEYIDHFIIAALFVIWLFFSIGNFKAKYIGIGMLSALLIVFSVLPSRLGLGAIALLSLPTIVVLIVYNWRAKNNLVQDQSTDLVYNYASIVGIVVGAISLLIAMVPIITGNLLQIQVRSFAYDVFLVLSSFSPVLLLLLITCIPTKLLINYASKSLQNKKNNALSGTSGRIGLSTVRQTVLLSLIILLSIAISLIPHIPTINKDNRQVGVDTGYYINWVNGLKSVSDPWELLHQAFIVQNEGQRPLSLLLIYSIEQITHYDLFTIVEYLPLLLGPALVLIVYFLTRELTSDGLVAIISGFLTVVSYQMLIGIYSGFYANWIALIFGYAAFLFLFRFLRAGGIANLVLYGTLALMTLFAHVYTWSILAIAAGIFLAVSSARTRPQIENSRKRGILLLMVLALTVAVDIGRAGIAGTSGGVEGDLKLAEEKVGPGQFLMRWNNLSYTTNTFVGGLFANFIILGLGLYWLMRADIRKTPTIFLLIFFSIGVLPFLFGEWIIQTRVFYDIPFQIPAAIALVQLAKSKRSLKPIPIFIWLAVIAVISVSNFYLVLPKTPA